ncbi:unnamed protein product, partial [Didymodactylos carnosus]
AIEWSRITTKASLIGELKHAVKEIPKTTCSYIALFVHTIIYYGSNIVKQFKTSLHQRPNDVHCVLMSKYSKVPEWWYFVVFCLSFIVAAVTCQQGDLMPWYYLFLAIAIAFGWLLPIGIVEAIANVNLFSLTAVMLVGAILFHKNGLANLTFQAFASTTISQALILLFSFKFGHYMKIPSRTIFITQLMITILNAIIKYSITYHLLNTVPDICSTQNWTCPNSPTTPILFANLGKLP